MVEIEPYTTADLPAIEAFIEALHDAERELMPVLSPGADLAAPGVRQMLRDISGGKGMGLAAAVDAKHHLIVAHEVTNTGHDRDQLSAMAGQGKAAMGLQALDVLADRGYFGGEEVLACEGSLRNEISKLEIQRTSS